MNIRNKYISIGLGTAIAFTSTCFNYGYFTAVDRQENIIELLAKAPHDYKFDFTELDIDDCHWYGEKWPCNHKEIELKYTVDKEKNQHVNFELIDSSLIFKDTSLEHDGGDKELDIKIDGSTIADIQIKSYTKDPQLLIKMIILNEDGSEAYSQYYKIWFKRQDGGNHKLNFKYEPVDDISNVLLDNSEIGEDVVTPPENDNDIVLPPESGEEVDPSLPDEDTKPVVPPSGEAGPSDEDKPSTDEKPQEPEINKPSTGEGTQKPEQEPPKEEKPKPEVVEPPKPEPQPDTPTTMPLDE